MGRAREMFGFVNRYVSLAGRSCCAGRSWVGLDRSLARRADGPPTGACQAPKSEAPLPEREEFVASGSVERSAPPHVRA